MKAHLLLADAVRAHNDGTFSLLRGGITQLTVRPGAPPVFRGSLVARVVGDASDAGKHAFSFACLDTSAGNSNVFGESAPSGDFEVPPEGGNANLCIDMQVELPHDGRYRFQVLVDGQALDEWDFDVTGTDGGQHGGKDAPDVEA